jgi:RNA polymerase-binding transcription factor DksA
MTATRLDKFEQRLLDERHRLAQLMERMAPAAEQAGDPGRLGDDRASDVATGGSSDDQNAVAARTLRELAEVDATLRMLYEDPELYGVCAACGRSIALGRLEMVPTTRFCQRHAHD